MLGAALGPLSLLWRHDNPTAGHLGQDKTLKEYMNLTGDTTFVPMFPVTWCLASHVVDGNTHRLLNSYMPRHLSYLSKMLALATIVLSHGQGRATDIVLFLWMT